MRSIKPQVGGQHHNVGGHGFKVVAISHAGSAVTPQVKCDNSMAPKALDNRCPADRALGNSMHQDNRAAIAAAVAKMDGGAVKRQKGSHWLSLPRWQAVVATDAHTSDYGCAMVESATGVGQPGRRRKRAELKELVLQAGFEVLVKEGLDLGVDHINYTKVFEHLEATTGVRVTRGSVHERIWDSQREFQRELVVRATEWQFEQSTAETLKAVGAIIAAADTSTNAGRQIAMREATRVGARLNLDSVENELWGLWQGITGAFTVSMVESEELAPVVDAVRRSYAAISDEWVSMHGQVAEALGWHIREDLELAGGELRRVVASITTATADGYNFREKFTGPLTFELPTGSNGESQLWGHLGYAVWLLIQSTYVNPPD